MRYWLLILFLPLVGSSIRKDGLTTHLTYDLMVNQTKAGEVKGSLIKLAGSQTIQMQTRFDINLLQTMKVDARFYSKYEKDFLVDAHMRKEINGKLDDESKIKWSGKEYAQEGPNKPTKLVGKIHFCVSKLYFSRPGVYKTLYSHSFGQMVSIQKVTDNSYELLLPDGKKNVYRYNDKGICDRVVVGGLFVKTELVLKEVRIE